MRILRCLPWLVPLAVVVLLVAGAVRAVQVPRVRLPDGTVLMLEAVTYGQEHRFVYRTWYERLQRAFLPFWPRRRSSGNGLTLEMGNKQDALVLWVLRRGKAANPPPLLRILDDQGREAPFPVATWHSQKYIIPGEVGKRQLETWIVSQFPRRGRTVTVRLCAPGTDEPLAEFRVRNPVPGPHPVGGRRSTAGAGLCRFLTPECCYGN